MVISYFLPIFATYKQISRLDGLKRVFEFEFNFTKSFETFPDCFELSLSHYGTP